MVAMYDDYDSIALYVCEQLSRRSIMRERLQPAVAGEHELLTYSHTGLQDLALLSSHQGVAVRSQYRSTV